MTEYTRPNEAERRALADRHHHLNRCDEDHEELKVLLERLKARYMTSRYPDSVNLSADPEVLDQVAVSFTGLALKIYPYDLRHFNGLLLANPATTRKTPGQGRAPVFVDPIQTELFLEAPMHHPGGVLHRSVPVIDAPTFSRRLLAEDPMFRLHEDVPQVRVFGDWYRLALGTPERQSEPTYTFDLGGQTVTLHETHLRYRPHGDALVYPRLDLRAASRIGRITTGGFPTPS